MVQATSPIMIKKGKIECAYRGLIYGVPGIGKSTWASKAPGVLFLNCENGLNRVEDGDKTELIESYDSLVEMLRWGYSSEYKTMVIDTIDAVEAMIVKMLCEKNGWPNLEKPGFGKGFNIAAEQWNTFLDIVDKIVMLGGKNVIFVGHDTIKSHNAPDADAYDRYKLKLNQKVAEVIIGRMDFVFFAQYEAVVKEDKTKDERVRAVGTGRAVLRTRETPAWIAKNRFNLAPTEPMFEGTFGTEGFKAPIFDKLV